MTGSSRPCDSAKTGAPTAIGEKVKDVQQLWKGIYSWPGGREPKWESTVGEQLHSNIHLTKPNGEAAFVELREARDKTLPMPKLILHALQININGGRLPEPEDNGRRYLKFPLDALQGAARDEPVS